MTIDKKTACNSQHLFSPKMSSSLWKVRVFLLSTKQFYPHVPWKTYWGCWGKPCLTPHVSWEWCPIIMKINLHQFSSHFGSLICFSKSDIDSFSCFTSLRCFCPSFNSEQLNVRDGTGVPLFGAISTLPARNHEPKELLRTGVGQSNGQHGMWGPKWCEKPLKSG